MSLKTNILAAMAVGSALLVSPFVPAAQASGQLTMICSTIQQNCDTIVAEFTRQTGIKVDMFRISAGEGYARIRAEARNPKADIWFGGTHDPHYQAADEGLTQPYHSPNLGNLIPLAQKMAEDADYKVASHAIVTIGFAYNTVLLQEKGLPEPTSWADLLREEYKGEIALSNPNTAGTGYSILVALVELMGEDGAFDYLKKLNANVSSYTKSGSAGGTQAARGEVAIGILFLSDANMLIRQGFPIKTASPHEGTSFSLDSVSIIKGARNLEEAKIFEDWILTPQAQSAVIEKGGMTYYPTAEGASVMDYTAKIDGVKLLDLDYRFYGSPETRKKLLARWDREIGAIAGN